VTARPLHVRIARRWRGATRATRAALLGASLSVVGWTLGWGPAPHAVAIGAASLLGALWPVRDREPAALRWVGDRVGLAYETALETAGGDDPYGLRAAVAVQGRLVVRDLAPPTPAAWWVPAALLAASLWAWGALLGAPWSLPWAAPGGASPSGPAGAPPGEAVLPFEPEVEPPAEGDAVEARVPAAGGADGAGAPGGAPGEAGPGGAPSERDALERFVEGLREREPTPEDEADRSAAAAAAAEEAEEAEGEGDPEDATTTPRAPDPGGEGERTDEAGDGEQGDETGAGDEGEGEQDAEAGGEGDQPGPAEAPSAEEGAADAAESGDGEAAGAAGFDPGEEGGDAGLGAGVEGEAGEGLDEAGAAPEALPSILGPGPETPVGGIALPGAAPETLPVGSAPPGFRQAVEQALIDGEVPVPYQEVIRNYFR
jgi:hypothetical protein